MKPDEAEAPGKAAAAQPVSEGHSEATTERAVSGEEATPSTRGWTMFTKDDEASDSACDRRAPGAGTTHGRCRRAESTA